MNWIFRVAECGIFALFVLCAREAFSRWRSMRDGGASLALLLSAALYAWIFEDLNVRRGGGRGAYSYNEKFSFFLDRVPLFIVLAWAVILWTSMRLTDRAAWGRSGTDGEIASGGMTKNVIREMARRVASDAVLAVTLDLSFDATAIRHEFWFWHGVGFDQAWFGVPAGNFFGWLMVSLCFSALTRALSSLNTRHCMGQSRGALFPIQMSIVPLVAFALYRGLESAVNYALLHLGWTSDRASLWAFFAMFTLVMLIAKARGTLKIRWVRQDGLDFWVRATFHSFAIIGLLLLPAKGLLPAQRPALLGIASLLYFVDLCLLEDWISFRSEPNRPA